MSGSIEFDDGTVWELGDSFAGGAHFESRRVNGQHVPGFITLRIIPAGGRIPEAGPPQEYRYHLSGAVPMLVSGGPR